MRLLIEKVAFGTPVNKGSNYIAGLTNANSLSSDIRALRQTELNTNDGISLVSETRINLKQEFDITARNSV
jgi:flagellin-like hook-associated protein FlgL